MDQENQISGNVPLIATNIYFIIEHTTQEKKKKKIKINLGGFLAEVNLKIIFIVIHRSTPH